MAQIGFGAHTASWSVDTGECSLVGFKCHDVNQTDGLHLVLKLEWPVVFCDLSVPTLHTIYSLCHKA